MSISELSELVDIPAETLRTWERRYGFPDPERTPSGHRRYAARVVPKLRLAKDLIARGHRPSMFMHEDAQRWRELAGIQQEGDERRGKVLAFRPPVTKARAKQIRQRWLGFVEVLDGEALRDDLHHVWSEQGTLAFLEPLLMSFLVEIGEAWHAGDLTVLHEQFASRHVEEFLRARWQPRAPVATKPAGVVASPPGEFHVLGLHAAAWLASAAGHKVIMAPRDLAPARISQLTHDERACALLVSASSAHPARHLTRFLAQLREDSSQEGAIVLGGSAQDKQQDVEGITCIARLGDLQEWIERERWKSAISSPHS